MTATQEPTVTMAATLSGVLQAAADSLAATRAVMETAAQTAFTFFADANPADRARLMAELSETALVHDGLLAGYARALDSGAAGGSVLVKELGYRNVAELLQHELGRKSAEAGTLVRLGTILRDGTYPTLGVALEDGRVSLHQAGVIVEVLDDETKHFDPEVIEYVEAAATQFATGDESALPMKPEQLRKLVRAWFKHLQPERTELEAVQQWQLREAKYGTTKAGMIRIQALLPAEEGAAVVQFMDANAAPRVRFTDPDLQETTCCCSNPEQQCGAKYDYTDTDTGAESVGIADETTNSVAASAGLVVREHCAACVPEDPRTRKQKMADAFSAAFTTAAKSKETSLQGGGYPTLVVTIPIEQLDTHASGEPAVATIGRTEEVVPAHVAARILCDGAVRAAVTGADNEVLRLGRAKRLFTPAQRTALTLTYPTCAVGDCDIPAVWTEAHHVMWWSRNGRTDTDNGILLCNFHHHEVHAGNLDIARDGKAWKVRRKARTRVGTRRDAGPGSTPSHGCGSAAISLRPPPDSNRGAGSGSDIAHPLSGNADDSFSGPPNLDGRAKSTKSTNLSKSGEKPSSDSPPPHRTSDRAQQKRPERKQSGPAASGTDDDPAE